MFHQFYGLGSNMAMAREVQRTFALARQKLGEVLSAVEFCDRSAIDFVFLGLNLKKGVGLGSLIISGRFQVRFLIVECIQYDYISI